MKIRHPYLLATIFLFVSTVYSAERLPSWFDGMENPPSIAPALPANFIPVSFWPDSKATKEFNMEAGVIWAPERTARHFEFGADRVLSNAEDPLFYVKLSASVVQTPGTDKFNVEDKVVEGLKSSGVRDVKARKIKWGKYPVLVMTGQTKDDLPMFTAFVGMNSPYGWTIVISYRVPDKKGHPTDEENKIWERFLEETKG